MPASCRYLTRRSSRTTALILTLALTVAPDSVAGTDPPSAAPGGEIPKHAAGGWPTELSGDDAKPARTPEQQAHLESVTGELRRLATTYGPDSVVLQSKFLIRSVTAGAVGPTAVQVAGQTASTAPEHLEINVETGIYFDDKSTTSESRRDVILKDIALPVLDEMESFKIEPSSLELVFLFDVQDLSTISGGGFDLSSEARHEAFRIRLGRPVLEDLIANRVAGDAVREKAELTPVVVAPRPDHHSR